MSEVILWTLDDGNTVNRLEMENDNEECYYFERLERVLATQVAGMMQNASPVQMIRNIQFWLDKVMAKQRWKAVKMKQKFDRQRFQNFSGSYSDQDLFISKGGSEKEIYVPEEGADTGLFASVLQVRDKYYPFSTKNKFPNSHGNLNCF